MICAAILVGIPLTLYGVYGNYKVALQSLPIYFRGEFVDYMASLFLAFGWVGVVMLACKSPVIEKLIGPLKAVGRAAFSNYILQTLICTTLFYGHGFRLYGHISRVGQFGIVLAMGGAVAGIDSFVPILPHGSARVAVAFPYLLETATAMRKRWCVPLSLAERLTDL